MLLIPLVLFEMYLCTAFLPMRWQRAINDSLPDILPKSHDWTPITHPLLSEEILNPCCVSTSDSESPYSRSPWHCCSGMHGLFAGFGDSRVGRKLHLKIDERHSWDSSTRTGSLFRCRELDARQCLSAKLNFLNRHWSQHNQAEENENETSLPLLWPQPPQIDSYCADCSTE